MPGKVSLQGVFLVDRIEEDPEKKTCTLHKIFNQIVVRRGAEKYVGECYLFFAVRQVHGRRPLRIVLEDLSDETELVSWPSSVQSSDPLETVFFSIRLLSMPIQKPGVYLWKVYDEEGELLGETRLFARGEE